MATTTKASATKTSTKKASTKKASTKKSAPKASAQKASKKADSKVDEFTAQAKEFFEQANDQFEANAEEAADRIESMMTEVVKFSKQAGYTTVGFPFALQSKYEAGTMADVESYKTILDDARLAGEQQVAEFQKNAEPYFKQVTDRIEPMISKWEDSLPENVRKNVQQNRERVSRVAKA